MCNRAFKYGSELPEYVALILRNGGSQSPGRWLRKPRNNHIGFFFFVITAIAALPNKNVRKIWKKLFKKHTAVFKTIIIALMFFIAVIVGAFNYPNDKNSATEMAETTESVDTLDQTDVVASVLNEKKENQSPITEPDKEETKELKR